VQESRDLVICNNCLWAASLLKDSFSTNFQGCPICGTRQIEIMPAGDYDGYKVSINKKRGIEIEFVNEK